jgi:predicted nuclease of restriction endonuclease-like RecB superfamily
MAAWIIPALKAVLPHVGAIISAAAPVFTHKRGEPAANQALLQEQIGELQAAASQNAAHVRELAAQLQSTVAALEQAAEAAQARLRRVLFLCAAAATLSAAALAIAAYLLLSR